MNNLAYIRIPKTGSETFSKTVSFLIKEENPCISIDHLKYSDFTFHEHSHDFFTTVRDPFQQHCSTYYFIKNRLNLVNDGMLDSADSRKRVLRKHIDAVIISKTLEDYLENSPENSFLTEYFGDLLPEDFCFIGETNQMDTSLAIFSIMFNAPIISTWVNKNPKRPYTLQPYFVEEAIKKSFVKKNENEYFLYNKSLDYFNELKKRFL